MSSRIESTYTIHKGYHMRLKPLSTAFSIIIALSCYNCSTNNEDESHGACDGSDKDLEFCLSCDSASNTSCISYIQSTCTGPSETWNASASCPASYIACSIMQNTPKWPVNGATCNYPSGNIDGKIKCSTLCGNSSN